MGTGRAANPADAVPDPPPAQVTLPGAAGEVAVGDAGARPFNPEDTQGDLGTGEAFQRQSLGITPRKGFRQVPAHVLEQERAASQAVAAQPDRKLIQSTMRTTHDKADPRDMQAIQDANTALGDIADERLNIQATNYGIMSEFTQDFSNQLKEDGERTRENVRGWFDASRKESLAVNKAIDDAASNRINPNEFFGNVGVAGTYSVALGVAVGHAASVMGGGPNTAFDILKSAIDRNVQAQRDNMQNDRNTATARQSYFNSLVSTGVQEANAENLLYAQMYKNAEYQLEALKQKTNSEMAKASLSETQHMLNLEYLQMKIKMDTANTTNVQRHYYEGVQQDASLGQKQSLDAVRAERKAQLEAAAGGASLQDLSAQLGLETGGVVPDPYAPPESIAAPAAQLPPESLAAPVAPAAATAGQAVDPNMTPLNQETMEAATQSTAARREIQKITPLASGLDSGIAEGADALGTANAIADAVAARGVGNDLTFDEYKEILEKYEFKTAEGADVPWEFFSNDATAAKFAPIQVINADDDKQGTHTQQIRWRDDYFDNPKITPMERDKRLFTIQTFVRGEGQARRLARLSQELGDDPRVGSNVWKQIAASLHNLISDNPQSAREEILALVEDEDLNRKVSVMLLDIEGLGKVERTNPTSGNVEALQSGQESEAQKKTSGRVNLWTKMVSGVMGRNVAAIRGATFPGFDRYRFLTKEAIGSKAFIADTFTPIESTQNLTF